MRTIRLVVQRVKDFIPRSFFIDAPPPRLSGQFESWIVDLQNAEKEAEQ